MADAVHAMTSEDELAVMERLMMSEIEGMQRRLYRIQAEMVKIRVEAFVRKHGVKGLYFVWDHDPESRRSYWIQFTIERESEPDVEATGHTTDYERGIVEWDQGIEFDVQDIGSVFDVLGYGPWHVGDHPKWIEIGGE